MTILSIQQPATSRSSRPKVSAKNILQYILLVLMVMMELIAIVGCVLPFAAHAQPSELSQLPFRFIDGTSLELADLKAEKYVMMANKDPQCHACEESLLHFTQQLSGQDSNLLIVWCEIEGNLQKREKLSWAKASGFRNEQVLFVSGQDMATMNSVFGVETFPALLLFNKKTGSCEVLAGERLFVDDYASSAIRPEAQKTVRRFLK